MSRTSKSSTSITTPYDVKREPWQKERGERYGNQRKAVARDKKMRRRQRVRELYNGIAVD